MKSDEIIETIIHEFRTLDCVNANAKHLTPKGTWNREFVNAFCNLGKKLHYEVSATKSKVDSEKFTNLWRKSHYDAMWLDSDENFKWVESIPMVAQCEWASNWTDICENTVKLLTARATLRVLVCRGHVTEFLDTINMNTVLDPHEVAEQIGEELIDMFKDTQVGDTYLLITYQKDRCIGKDYHLRYFKILGENSGSPTNWIEIPS